MKKSSILLLLLAVLIAAPTGGYFLLQYRIEQNIRNGLADFSVSLTAPEKFDYGKVSVDLWHDRAFVHDLALVRGNGQNLAIKQLVLTDIRDIDTEKEITDQFLSFELSKIFFADPSRDIEELNAETLTAVDSNLASLLLLRPGDPQEFIMALQAAKLSGNKISLVTGDRQLAIDRVIIEQLSAGFLGDGHIENLAIDSKSNIGVRVPNFRIEDTNILERLAVFVSGESNHPETRKRLLKSIKIGSLETGNLSVEAADGDFSIDALVLEGLDGGQIKAFRLVGLKQTSVEKTAVNLTLGEIILNDGDFSAALRPSAPRNEPEPLEALNNFRDVVLGEFKVSSLKGGSAILSGEIGTFHLQDLREGLFSKMDAANVKFSLPGTGDVALAKLAYNITGRMGIFASHGDYTVSGLVIRPVKNEQTRPMLEQLGLDEIELSSAASVDWDIMARRGKSQQSIDIKQAAGLSAELSFAGLPTATEVENLQQLVMRQGPETIKPESLLPYFSELVLESFTFAFRDHGLLPAALRLTAAQNQQPVENLRDALANQAEILAISYFGETAGGAQAKALRGFIETGGSLTVRLSIPGGEPLFAILALTEQPLLLQQKVKIDIRHQP